MSQIKIKIFDETNQCESDRLYGYSLEYEINQWLLKNRDIQIVSTSAGFGKYYILYYSWKKDE